MTARPLSYNDYSVGWICALSKELTAATAMLDEEHDALPVCNPNDHNSYTLGAIGKHNVVLVCLPEGEIGNNPAANVVTQMINTFPSIRFGLMVGIGGGIPPHVRLGDVVVSRPVGEYPGVVQWDLGKATGKGFKRTGSLDRPPKVLLSALTALKTKHEMKGHNISQTLAELADSWPKLAAKYTWSDRLRDTLLEPDNAARIKSGCRVLFITLWQVILTLLGYLLGRGDLGRFESINTAHTVTVDDERIPGEPKIHYGLVASGNQVIKDGSVRDDINRRLGGQVLCLEMEAAGVMNNFPCLIIRGICDYADSRKNDHWQEYAAAIAAAFTKEFLQSVQPAVIEKVPPVRDILNQVYDEVVAARADVAQVRSKIDRQEEKQILDWLTPTDYGPLHSDYCKRRQTGTGHWLLESKQFQDWITGTNHVLFCHGIPGAGKTILTSLVINHLSSKFKSDPEIGIAFIYCNFRRQEDQDFERLLASLLKQLAGGRHSLPESTKELYRQHSIRKTQPTPEELLIDLECVISQYSETFIIIDALDECQLSGLNPFLSKLYNFQKRHKMKILATSRPIPEITDWFNDIDSVKLEIRADMSDITKFIDARMDLLPYVVRRDLALKEEIKANISEVVDGMFLLAQVYLILLQDKTTANDIRTQLAIFKIQTQGKRGDQKEEILADAYEQAIERINCQKEGLRSLALRALSWIIFSKREITMSELQHALATRDGMPTLNLDDLPDLNDIGSVCVGLVTVDERSGIIRLVHYTAYTYLEQTQNRWFPDANATILRCCLTYLSFKAFESGFCQSDEEFEDRNESFPLLYYAANHWIHHLSHDMETSDEVIRFLESQTRVEASIQALFAVKLHPFHRNYSQEPIPRNATGLHLAAFFGMVEATRSLLGRGYSPNAKASNNETPLLWASYNGHEAVAKLLIDAGAALEVRDSKNGLTPLMPAAERGHEAMVALLLDRGSDINSRDYAGRTPLSLAAISDQKLIMNLLLRNGGTIDNDDKHGRVKLLCSGIEITENLRMFKEQNRQPITKNLENEHHMPEIGSDSMIEQLIEYYGGLHGHHRTLISWAAGAGRRNLVELLIERGMIDLNIADGEAGMMPLHCAAIGGHTAIVELLVNAGADLEAKSTEEQMTPLAMAILKCHNDVVDFLLRRGSNVNTTNADGQTPLLIAAYKNNGVIPQLLDKGADVNARSNDGLTPLLTACHRGNYNDIRLLVEGGADVNGRDRDRTPILTTAATLGNIDVVRLLIERGADITAEDKDGATALLMAVACGHINVLRLLIERGADVKAENRHRVTALQLAAALDQAVAVQVLVSQGADINVQDEDGRSPLFYAIEASTEATVIQMLQTDAVDVNKPDAMGISPIALAKKLKKEKIIQLLLQTGKITDYGSVFSLD